MKEWGIAQRTHQGQRCINENDRHANLEAVRLERL